MARVTIEDCLEHVENKFQLATIAAKRARQLARGANSQLDWEDDKPTVLALREIAEGHISPDILKEPDLPPLSAAMETPRPVDDEDEAEEPKKARPAPEAE